VSIPGPKPKPAEVAAKQGNPGHRTIVKTPDADAASSDPTMQPSPPASNAAAPEWLDEMGHKVWQLYMPRLKGMGYVKDTDMLAFARLCDHTARWLRLRDKVDAVGESYETESRHGKMQRINPDFAAMLRIEEKMVQLEDRFGLTPSSRQQILARFTEPTVLPLVLTAPAETATQPAPAGSPVGMFAPRGSNTTGGGGLN